MAENRFLEKAALVAGLVSSVLFIHTAFFGPPIPKCPKCSMPQSNPGQRYSKCPKCGQLMDWMVEVEE